MAGSPPTIQAVAEKLAAQFTPKKGDKSPVIAVWSYDANDVVRKKLISHKGPNGQAVLAILQLDSEFMAVDNMPFLKSVYAKVHEMQKSPDLPAGLQIGVTGSASIGSDMLWSMEESIHNTELTTIALVIVILLIVYRAPGLLLVPLLSIAVSFVVSLDLIALVAQWCNVHAFGFSDLQDDADIHRRDPLWRGDRLLLVPHRPLS